MFDSNTDNAIHIIYLVVLNLVLSMNFRPENNKVWPILDDCVMTGTAKYYE